jgi:hypothetical protein
MAYQARLARPATTILTAAALTVFTAGLAMAHPGVAYASGAINIGNGDVGALYAALADAPANGVREVINLAAGGTYPLTAVYDDTYGPTGLPLIPAGADVDIQGHGSTIERVDAPVIPDFNILTVPPASTFALQNVTVSGGSVDGNGGGIEALGDLTITDSTISDNTAGGNGGGINDDDSADGTVTVSRSTISGNTAGGNGGGINDVSGQYDGNNGTLTVSRSTVSGNTASGDGGGVDAFDTISDSTFTGNAAFDGGAIYNEDDTNATVEDSTINANTASEAGGGLYLSAANLLSSTVSGNTAGGDGGGVFTNADNNGDFPYLEHDTITLNDGQNGSGLSIENSFDNGQDSGLVSVGDCIISGNEGSQTDGDTNVGTVDNATGYGTYVFSMGYNLLGFSTSAGQDPAIGFFGGPGDQRGTYVSGVGYLGVDAGLLPLHSNGGPTKTQLPGNGSPAIDAGDNTLSADPGTPSPPPAPTTDQRGLPRVVTLAGYPDLTDGTDIGAVELATAPAASLVVTTTDDDSHPGKTLSLRAALSEAIAANVNTVTFDIPGPGPHTIHLKSALPEITGTANISIDNASGQAVIIKAPVGVGAFKADYGSQLSLSGVTLRGDGTSGNGINSDGTLDLTNSTITGFGGTGLVISESLTMSDSKVTDNGDGGIVDQSYGGTITITGSTFSGNHSGTSGGAISFANTEAPAEVTITGSVFTGNSAAINGGGIDMEIAENSSMTIADCTMSHNTAAALGGALYLSSQQTIITNSTMTGNTADTGGAIAALGADLTVETSTLNSNKAVGGATPDGFGAGEGGGLFVNGPTTVTNSTLSGNTAAGAGGGAYVNYDILTVSSSTITGNTAPAGNGGGIATYGGQAETAQATVTNSIIDKNHGDDVDLTQGTDPPGFVSNGYNLIGTGNDVSAFNQPGDQTGVSQPKTGPLASNGGPTKTHALLPGSPAIGTGDNADCPSTDQRGLPRPQGSGCDIGSFQLQTG